MPDLTTGFGTIVADASVLTGELKIKVDIDGETGTIDASWAVCNANSLKAGLSTLDMTAGTQGESGEPAQLTIPAGSLQLSPSGNNTLVLKVQGQNQVTTPKYYALVATPNLQSTVSAAININGIDAAAQLKTSLVDPGSDIGNFKVSYKDASTKEPSTYTISGIDGTVKFATLNGTANENNTSGAFSGAGNSLSGTISNLTPGFSYNIADTATPPLPYGVIVTQNPTIGTPANVSADTTSTYLLVWQWQVQNGAYALNQTPSVYKQNGSVWEPASAIVFDDVYTIFQKYSSN